MCAAIENTWASPEKARPLQAERQDVRVAQEGTNEGDKPRVVPGTKAETAAGEDDAKAASNSSAHVREVDPGATDVDMTAGGGIATKRAREASDSTGNVGTSGTGEPPTKTATGRRPTFKPRPNLPTNGGAANYNFENGGECGGQRDPEVACETAKIDTGEKTDRNSEKDLKTATDEAAMDTSGAPLKRTLEEDPQGNAGDTSTKKPTPFRRKTLRPSPNLQPSRKSTDPAPT
ncbi:hypothetical protein MTO96_005741 [Rhipicephalus appendiculatus]